MKLESKRHIIKFYVLVAFVFLIFNAIGALLINVFFNEEERAKGDKTYFLSAMGILFVMFAFYTVYQYLKNTPKIIVEKNRIFFNKEMFNINDIRFINLACKIPFKFIGRYPMEGFYIEFKNGKEKFVYDDMYSNIWKIKDYLKQVVEDKKEYKPIKTQEINPSQVENEHFAYYSNFQLLGFSGITHFGFILFLIYMSFINDNINGNYFIIILILVFFLFHSWLSHHYGISKNHLIIKNFNLPFIFITKVYKLDDIEEIVFETHQKRPNGLRVITKNFQSKLFYGASLYDNTWRELKKDLRKKGI